MLVTVALLLLLFCVFSSNGQTADNPLRYELVEDSLPGSVIGNVKHDAQLQYAPDVLDTLTFSFLTAGDIKHSFDVSDDGTLMTSRIIDRDALCPGEAECVIRLDIGVQPSKYFQTIKVDLRVIDINDNRPHFAQDHVTYALTSMMAPCQAGAALYLLMMKALQALKPH